MSKGLSILGGIGQGLMQGSQFMAQQRERDANRKFNTARLGMLEEQHGWKQEDRAAQQAEQARTGQLTTAYRGLVDEGMQPGTPDFYREYSKRTFQFAKPDELEALDAKIKGLEQTEIGNALLMQDAERFAQLYAGKVGEPVQVTQTQGQDAFGNPQPIWGAVGQSGKTYFQLPTSELGAIYGRKEMLDIAKHRAEQVKTHSAVRKNEAQAGAARAMADWRRSGGANGRGSSPTTGFSAVAREESTRAALRRKLEAGDATAEEIDLLAVLDAQAERRDEANLPAGARAARHWSSASPEAIEREVERQLAELRIRSVGDPLAQATFRDPAALEALKSDIRRKLGAGDRQHLSTLRGDGAPDAPHGTANGHPAADPLAPNEKRPSLNTFFR